MIDIIGVEIEQTSLLIENKKNVIILLANDSSGRGEHVEKRTPVQIRMFARGFQKWNPFF